MWPLFWFIQKTSSKLKDIKNKLWALFCRRMTFFVSCRDALKYTGLKKPSGERTKRLKTRFKSSCTQRSNLRKLWPGWLRTYTDSKIYSQSMQMRPLARISVQLTYRNPGTVLLCPFSLPICQTTDINCLINTCWDHDHSVPTKRIITVFPPLNELFTWLLISFYHPCLMSLFTILHSLEIETPHRLRISIHLLTERSRKEEPSKWVCLVMIIIFFLICSSLVIIRCNNSAALGGKAFLLS